MSIRLKLIASFKKLSIPKRVLAVTLLGPLALAVALFALGLSNVVAALFALPIIGFGVSRNSWRAGKRKSDGRIYFLFALSLIASVVLLLVLRQPEFRTDWEGGNPLDDLIALVWVSTLVALSATWTLAGWVIHRLVMSFRSQKNRGVAAPE